MPATMETPLDVLSRAASMVETHEAREAAMKRTIDRRDSPPKELPSKFHKYRRLKERGELANTLGFDESHADRCSKRCAGTQTPHLNFSQDPAAAAYAHYQKQRDEHSSYVADLEGAKHPGHSPTQNGGSPPRLGASLTSQPQQDHSNVPLNLSLSSASHQYRQSVITCPSNNGRDNSPDYRPRHREVTQVEISDPVIEEHFRRSLGKNYPECLGRQPQQSQGPTPSSQQNSSYKQASPPVQSSVDRPRDSPTVSVTQTSEVTGTVDDHFAKSLGSEWNKIKARQAPAGNDQMGETVDDHFAKALGDTWYKIKAEKEGSSSPSHSPLSSSPPSPTSRSSQSGL